MIGRKDANLWVSLFLLIFSIGVANEAYRLGLGDPHSRDPGFMFFGASSILGLLSLHLFFKSFFSNFNRMGSIVDKIQKIIRGGKSYVINK